MARRSPLRRAGPDPVRDGTLAEGMGRRWHRIVGPIVVGAFLLPAATARSATLTTFELESRFVNPAAERFNPPPPGVPPRPNALRANVLLPDGYDGRRRFPVLYLLHGYSGTYDIWAHPERGDVVNTARGFPGVIVMPEGGTGFYANWWKGGRRGDPAWERHYLEELIPAIHHRFRIRRGRRWHAIAGFSMGGEGAATLASRWPGYFGSLASFSGSLSTQRPEMELALMTVFQGSNQLFGDPIRERFYWTGHNPTALVANLRHTRAYISAGDGVPSGDPEELNNLAPALELFLRPQSQDFVAGAREHGVDVTWRPHRGVHWYMYWRRDLIDAIDWGFFRRVQSRPARWTYDTVARRGDAWGFRFRFRQPPEAVVRLARIGRTLTGQGEGELGIRTPGGCVFRTRLPFSRHLPGRCLQ